MSDAGSTTAIADNTAATRDNDELFAKALELAPRFDTRHQGQQMGGVHGTIRTGTTALQHINHYRPRASGGPFSDAGWQHSRCFTGSALPM